MEVYMTIQDLIALLQNVTDKTQNVVLQIEQGHGELLCSDFELVETDNCTMLSGWCNDKDCDNDDC
jgi:hypothetical protein